MIKEEASKFLCCLNEEDDKEVKYLGDLGVLLRQSFLDASFMKNVHFEDASVRCDLMEKVGRILRFPDEKCSICEDKPNQHEWIVSTCLHLFCDKCFNKIQSCPLPTCNQKPSTATYIFPTLEVPTKFQSLLQLLLTDEERLPTRSKSVVYSLFPGVLRLLESLLKEKGVPTILLDRKVVDLDARNEIKSAMQSEDAVVLLVTYDAISSSIFSGATTRAYFLEVWKPRAEFKGTFSVGAIRRDIPVVRLIAKDTGEMNMLKLEEDKVEEDAAGSSRKGGKGNWCGDGFKVTDVAYFLSV